jgi:filamentous hemagglutinin family protein
MKLFSNNLCILFLTANLIGLPELGALPSGTKTVSGDASFSLVDETAKELQITAGDGAILEHLAFDVAADETVRFIQPSIEARVLNRISAAAPSLIDGKLIANGHVYLVNPAGVLFGEGSIVEAGKLHAVAGNLSNSDFENGVDKFTALSGEVKNQGSITAGEVVLAGSSLSNSGAISAPDGLVLLAVGGGLELSSLDGSLSVSLDATAPEGAILAVGDLAGQAILQSGIIQASRVEMHGASVTHSGSVSATDAKVANFTTFAGSTGSFSVTGLSVSGGSKSTDAASFDLTSKSNLVSKLEPSGVFENLSLRSSNSLTLGTASDEQEAPAESAFQAQNVDFRVDSGDLTLAVPFSPHSTALDNSLLLAAEDKLSLSYELAQYDYLRRILYGRNLSAGTYTESTLELGAIVSLDAISVFMDDLSPTLSPTVIRALSVDNPGFEGFDSDGLLQLSAITDSQLELLFQFGLFTGYSYFLQAPSAEAVFAKDMADSGGAVSAFGGSFAVVAGGASATSPSSSSGSDSDDGGDSDDGDDSGDGDGDGDGEGEGGGAAAAAAKAASAIPFAPISRPILSPAAGKILDAALSDEVEVGLQKYLDQ